MYVRPNIAICIANYEEAQTTKMLFSCTADFSLVMCHSLTFPLECFIDSWGRGAAVGWWRMGVGGGGGGGGGFE